MSFSSVCNTFCHDWEESIKDIKCNVYFTFINRDASGKFPDFPGEDEGGSAAIFKEKDPAEVEAEIAAKVGVVTDVFSNWAIKLTNEA